MTSVICTSGGRDRAGRLAQAVATAVGGTTVVALGVVVVLADRDASRHSVWRDPLSWFASDEAPTPQRVRLLLTVLGCSMIVLAGAGVVRRRPVALVAAVGLAGALVVGLAHWSIECSLRFAYCRGRVEAGFVDDAHLVHVVISIALVVMVVAVLIGALHHDRTPMAAVRAGLGAAAAVTIVAAPANPWVGALQMVLFATGGWATVHLWRGTT